MKYNTEQKKKKKIITQDGETAEQFLPRVVEVKSLVTAGEIQQQIFSPYFVKSSLSHQIHRSATLLSPKTNFNFPTSFISNLGLLYTWKQVYAILLYT